jgi:ABC-2 type transport system ATP-binding protein
MDPGAPYLVRASSLSKRFGAKQALEDVSFTARRGEILGILGPNGAGKSTLIAILSGLMDSDGGSIEIFGQRLGGDRAAILSRINIASPYASLPGPLTVRQNLSIYADLYGVPRPRERISHLLDLLGMLPHAETRFQKLSSGQAVRACLCKALLNAPELLLLDEPTAYLDTEIAGRTRALLAEERSSRGMTVLLTSHNLPEIEELCDRILLLSHGRLVAKGTALEVTRAILGRHREQPALDEVFANVARADLKQC